MSLATSQSSQPAEAAGRRNRSANRSSFKRPLWKRLWYGTLWVVCRILSVAVFHIRCSGGEHMPRTGGVLVLSNHQSNFDPLLVGLTLDRQMSCVARRTLFRFPLFRWLIEGLDAIPIEREGTGFGGLKETMRRLKAGDMVLLFPEGTRTSDGEVQPLKPGFTVVAQRAGVPILPMAIDGAFDSWPRTRKLPRRATIHICVGAPIPPEEAQRLTDRELLAEIERRIRECHAQARAGRMLALGRVQNTGDT